MVTDMSLEVVRDMNAVTNPFTRVDVFMEEYEGEERISRNLVYTKKLEGEHKSPFIMNFDDTIGIDLKFLESVTKSPSSFSAKWNANTNSIVMKTYRRDMSKSDCEEFGEKIYQGLVDFDKQ